MTHEMIEKYIYAVTKRIPKKLRGDDAKELEELVSDMLEERCGDLPPSDKDIRVVLTEIGTPDEFALKYLPNSEKYLMGEPYYSRYILTAKITCFVVFAILTVSSIANLTLLLHLGAMRLEHLLIGFLLVLFGTFAAFGIVTLIFWMMERKRGLPRPIRPSETPKRTPQETAYILEKLPPLPQKHRVKIMVESIVGIILWTLFGGVVLFVAIRQPFLSYMNYPINIINTEQLQQGLYWGMIIMVLGIVRESIKLRHRRYTTGVLCASVMLNTAMILSSVLWLSHYQLFNSYLGNTAISTRQNTVSQWMQSSVASNVFDGYMTMLCNNALSIMVFLLALDIFVTAFRYLKSSHALPSIKGKRFSFRKLKRT